MSSNPPSEDFNLGDHLHNESNGTSSSERSETSEKKQEPSKATYLQLIRPTTDWESDGASSNDPPEETQELSKAAHLQVIRATPNWESL